MKPNTRRWLLVKIVVSRAAEEPASALLFELGSTGVVTLSETTDDVQLGAYFDGPADEQEIRSAIKTVLGNELHDVCFEQIADQDWMQKWKEGFEPIKVGNRLIVAPSWSLPENADDRIVIQIDPGMAFGTGTHETTRLCLEAIERYWRGGSFLDVGTGTGILAIAAALLARASRVVAIDVDPQAVEVARENIAINRVSEAIELAEAQPGALAETFDVVVANLTAEVIIDLLNDLARCVAPGAILILSGILSELASDVQDSLETVSFKVVECSDDGEWCALTARKEPSSVGSAVEARHKY